MPTIYKTVNNGLCFYVLLGNEELIFNNMFEIPILAALRLVFWERSWFTFKTSRAEDIGGFACK